MKAPMGISWHIGGQPGLALLAAVARGTEVSHTDEMLPQLSLCLVHCGEYLAAEFRSAAHIVKFPSPG